MIGFPETRGRVCRDRLSDFTAASEMHPQPISQVWGSGDRAGDTPGGLGAARRAATWRSRRRGPHLPTPYSGCDHTPDPGSKASAQGPQISPHPHGAGLTPCLEAHDLLLSLATCCPRGVGGRGRGHPEPSAPPSPAQSPLDPSGRAPEPPAKRMKLLLPIRNALLTPRPSSRTHFPPTLAICTLPSPMSTPPPLQRSEQGHLPQGAPGTRRGPGKAPHPLDSQPWAPGLGPPPHLPGSSSPGLPWLQQRWCGSPSGVQGTVELTCPTPAAPAGLATTQSSVVKAQILHVRLCSLLLCGPRPHLNPSSPAGLQGASPADPISPHPALALPQRLSSTRR